MKKQFVSGVMVLTLSSFLIKVMGFITRIYMSNVMGAEGTGVYQLIMSVYAVGASFAVSGISVAVCTLTGARPAASHKIVKSALAVSLTTGFIASLICFVFAEKIAFLVGDLRAAFSIRIISLCFPFTSLFASLTGYFNGRSKVKIPVVGQIAEQGIRILIVFVLIEKAMKKGIILACVTASVGIAAGEAISAIFLVAVYLKTRTYGKVGKSCKRKLLSLSIPAAVGGYFNSILHTVENALIPVMLGAFGFSHSQAVASLGVIKGMAAPICYFPNILISSVATVILPAVSYASEHGRKMSIRYSSDCLFRLCFTCGGFFAAFFCSFGKEISMLLFKNAHAGEILSLLGIITPFLYINMVSGSILYGAGMQKTSLSISVFEGVSRVAGIMLFVPHYGIYGYIAAVILSDVFACILNIRAISKACDFKFCCIKYFVCASVSFFIAVIFGNSLNGIYRYPAVIASYFLCMLMLKTVKISDIMWIKSNIFSK